MSIRCKVPSQPKGADCDNCGRNMMDDHVLSCNHRFVKIGGKLYKRNTSYYDYNERCHDCNIVNGEGHVHHFGCDVERCPKCKCQLIGCDCNAKPVKK
jgi:hypothetical protein